jgi:HK97 gp10 family phage protein
MGNNPSVRRFRTDMQDLVNKAKYNFHQELLAQADEVIANMKEAAPKDTGRLAASIRKKDVSLPDGGKLSVLIIAGGRSTTKRSGGQAYDYSLGTEFGTVKETPEPFFYNTFRFYKQLGNEQFRETLQDTIEENNRVRGLRSDNYSNSGATVSVGYRGAAVLNKGKP